MSIRLKISIPLIILTVVLGVTSWLLVRGQLETLSEHNLKELAETKANEVRSGVDDASRFALYLASLAAGFPGVDEAYQIALAGDIDDPASPEAQMARESLRELFERSKAAVAANMDGQALRIHFHLPNGRSLVRLWRDKQARRDGEWVDISDDISGFRQTVLDVNADGGAVSGIELGRGGFVMRGLAPVQGEDGDRLGSVEALVDFAPVMEASAAGEGQKLFLFMNQDKLDITTRLQDPQKHPMVGNRYVFVSEAGGMAVDHQAFSVALLDAGRESLSVVTEGDLELAAFPIRDYQGAQIGVMALAMDISGQNAIIGDTMVELLAVFAALLIIPVVIIIYMVGRLVARPVTTMTDMVKTLGDNREDLKKRLDDTQNDEIGKLATAFNRMLVKIEDIFCQVEGYQNLVDAVPDPIFAVDDDFKILTANKATMAYLGCSLEELKKSRCMDKFKTMVCGTEKCPIAEAKKRQGAFTAEIINIGTEEKPVYIQPVGDMLRDCYGQKVGYVEVARIVTDMVLTQHETERAMQRLEQVNHEIRDATGEMVAATDQLGGRFQEITHGAEAQSNRAGETATAMDEMNATVMEVAQSASDAANQADQARAKADEGSEVVGQVVSAISHVRAQAVELKNSMGDLGDRVEGIGRIMSVITDIADQTNLLALNAAIEAARAGEAGRGFAVVADEVRKLAERTMAATKEVGDAVTAIQTGARRNVEVVDAAAAAVEEATGLASRSGDSLQQIVALVAATTDRVQSIATAAEEQSAASEEINAAVSEVNRIAQETSQGMDEANRAVDALMAQAERLRNLAGR